MTTATQIPAPAPATEAKPAGVKVEAAANGDGTKPAGVKVEAAANGDGTKPVKIAKPRKPRQPKEAKPEGESTVVRSRQRLIKYPDESLITVLKPDSKSRGAKARFSYYQTGMTVKDYIAKIHEVFGYTSGQVQADMRWDADHQFVHIGPTVIAVPEPPKPEISASAPAPAPEPNPPAAA